MIFDSKILETAYSKDKKSVLFSFSFEKAGVIKHQNDEAFFELVSISWFNSNSHSISASVYRCGWSRFLLFSKKQVSHFFLRVPTINSLFSILYWVLCWEEDNVATIFSAGTVSKLFLTRWVKMVSTLQLWKLF